MQKIIISFLFSIISLQTSAQRCFRLAYQIDDIFTENQQFEIDENHFSFGDKIEEIKSTKTLMFYDFLRVKAFFKCRFDFPMIMDEEVYLLTEIEMVNQERPIHIISSDSTNLSYLIFKDQPYLMTGCEDLLCYDSYLYNDELQVNGVFINKTYSDPKASYITKYDTLEETVLSKSKYTEIKKVPPQFVLAKKEIITKQHGICPDHEYVYTTVLDSFVSKESYNDLLIYPATFDTLSESVLLKEAHKIFSDVMLKEAVLQKEVIQISPKQSTWQISYDSISSSLDPFNTLNFDFIEIPPQFDTLDIWRYDSSCPEGYNDHDILCTKTIEVPSEYSTRTYEKLSTPASSISIYKPSQYTYYQKTLIQNIDSVPVDCVVEIKDSVSYEKLVSPSNTITNIIPTKYENRTYQKLISQIEHITVTSTEIEKVTTYKQKTRSSNQSILETICFDNLDTLLIKTIADTLQSKGVDIDSNDYPTSLFWYPLITYQSQQNLPIGRINSVFLKHLNIE